MNGGDTSLGGSQGAFPLTTWGLISGVSAPGGPDHRNDLETLCRRYWKPVYRYVRIAWAKSNEDAKDLTQAFFLWLFDGEVLGRYEADRGSFRKFLKVLLDRFVNDRERALHRLKRGGGVALLPLDADAASFAAPAADPQTADPVKAFDRAWLAQLMQHAVDQVRARYAVAGNAVRFRVFEEYDLTSAPERPTYGELATRLGLKENEVTHFLAAVRADVSEELRAELRSLTSGEREFEEEWNDLFGS